MPTVILCSLIVQRHERDYCGYLDTKIRNGIAIVVVRQSWAKRGTGKKSIKNYRKKGAAMGSIIKGIFVYIMVNLIVFYPLRGALAEANHYRAIQNDQESLIERFIQSQETEFIQISEKEDIEKSTKTRVLEAYGKLPLHFIKNNGQVSGKVLFYEKGSSHTTFFTKEGVYLSLIGTEKKKTKEHDFSFGNRRQGKDLKSEFIKLIPLGANKDPEVIGGGLQDGKVNYFLGNDVRNWRTNIATYSTVLYREVYKGIDIKYYGNNRQLEYDIIVKPRANPDEIKLSYEGIEKLKVTGEGNLEICLKEGTIIQRKPHIYQEIEGKRVVVPGRFKVHDAPLSYSFEVASYNKAYPLIIDPVLIYSTYLGGSDWDSGLGIAVDSSGSAYVTGHSDATNFPTKSPIQGSNAGYDDVFVTKINASGSALVYSTYLGGSDEDEGWDIAVDTSGNAYVTGHTYSTNFPTKSPIQGSNAGGSAAFVTKINASGSAIVYSTYLGGSDEDEGLDIAVDTSGNAYVTGQTYSTNFPTKSPIQGSNAGGCDAFVTKINTSGSALIYSTYLGGSGHDFGYGISVDSSGNAYITGYTSSTNFPTKSPIQGSNAGGYDAFVTKINTSGSALIYSTYLGGSGEERGFDIAVDSSGNTYITGYTFSTNFPTASPIQVSNAGGCDAFVAKMNTSGSALIFSTFLGGTSADIGLDIVVDSSGNSYITGSTYSTNFPTASPIQGSNAGDYDAFVTKINTSGSSLVFSTYLGGSDWDEGIGIAVDTSGNAYVTGSTASTDFPTKSPIQGSKAGEFDDAFVTKIALANQPLPPSPPSSLVAKAISSSSIVLTWKDNSTNETGFKIEKKLGGCNSTNDWKQIATVKANITTYTNTGLTANTTYSYRVRAYNAGGNSAYSNCASAKTGVAGSPNAPTNLSATSISASSIKICWTDSSTNVTSFKIYRKIGTGSWNLLSETGADTGCYTDNTASGNTSTTTYNYYIQACNSSGCSPTTNTAIVLYRPTNLAASAASSSKINLTWEDKSNNEAGFQIYRKSGACSLTNPWSPIITVGTNSTSYGNTGLSSATTYSYKVRAYYKTFAQPYAYGYSLYSNCDDATTLF